MPHKGAAALLRQINGRWCHSTGQRRKYAEKTPLVTIFLSRYSYEQAPALPLAAQSPAGIAFVKIRRIGIGTRGDGSHCNRPEPLAPTQLETPSRHPDVPKWQIIHDKSVKF